MWALLIINFVFIIGSFTPPTRDPFGPGPGGPFVPGQGDPFGPGPGGPFGPGPGGPFGSGPGGPFGRFGPGGPNVGECSVTCGFGFQFTQINRSDIYGGYLTYEYELCYPGACPEPGKLCRNCCTSVQYLICNCDVNIIIFTNSTGFFCSNS